MDWTIWIIENHHNDDTADGALSMTDGALPMTDGALSMTDDALSGADAVVILTDHTDIDYDRVVAQSQVLVDARHVAPRPEGTEPFGWIVKG